jgi:hypothetical protein
VDDDQPTNFTNLKKGEFQKRNIVCQETEKLNIRETFSKCYKFLKCRKCSPTVSPRISGIFILHVLFTLKV